MIEVFVEGVPKGQPRIKAFVRGGHAAVYTPSTADSWKDCIKWAMKPHRPEKPLEGPIIMAATFHMPRPKSHYKANGDLKATAPTYHISKPDRDNAEKVLLDALTELGYWRDDAQVCAGEIMKVYANGLPGARIEIRPLVETEVF